MSDDVSLQITGDNTSLLTALDQSAAAVKAATEEMKGSFESLKTAAESVSLAMVAITTVLGGGKIFSEAITAAAGAAVASRDMGEQLGISATKASVLSVAMDQNLVSHEAFEMAAKRIVATLNTNEAAFAQLGVATRDANGDLRNVVDIVADVNTALGSFTEGTSRDIEATKIYGKGWQEVLPTLRLTKTAMMEAQQSADALGLTVGEKGLSQSLAYEKSMAGVKEVLEGVWKAIGEGLMPALTGMGNWLASIGPSAVQTMKEAMLGLTGAFEALKLTVQVAWELLAGALEQLLGAIDLVMDALNRMAHGDFKGAIKGIADDWKIMQDAANQRMDNIKQHALDAYQQISDAAERAYTKDAAIAEPPQGKNATPKADTDQMAGLEAQLAATKTNFEQMEAAQGSFVEFSKQMEIDYWQQVLATKNLAASEIQAVQKKIWDLTYAVDKQGAEQELAQMKAQQADHKGNLDLQLEDTIAYAEKVKQIYGAESTEYAQAESGIVAVRRAITEQVVELAKIQADAERDAQLKGLSEEEEILKEKLSNKAISVGKYIQLETDLEDRIYAIKLKALQEDLAMEAAGADNPIQVAKINAQIEALEAAHSANLVKINQTASTQLDAMYKQLGNSIANSLTNAFMSIIKGTETLSTAMKKMFMQMAEAVVQALAKMVAQQIAQHVLSMVLNKQEAGSNAGVAATGAAKSAANIPYVGWILAPIAAAAVYAMAMGYSAAQGFDIPAGLNPMTQLHEKEMVLPASLAETVRSMASTSEGGTRATGGDTHYNIQAIDSESIEKALTNNLSRNAMARVARQVFHRSRQSLG